MTTVDSSADAARLSLQAFAHRLRELADDRHHMRPLLCEGSPLACNIAIVGANPATKTPFWPYWDDMSGMSRSAWIADYLAREKRFRRSRSAIERLVPQIAAPVIELNAYAAQSNRLAVVSQDVVHLKPQP